MVAAALADDDDAEADDVLFFPAQAPAGCRRLTTNLRRAHVGEIGVLRGCIEDEDSVVESIYFVSDFGVHWWLR